MSGSLIGSLNIFAPNTVILSALVNTNFSDIKTAFNANFHETTGHGHTGVSGDGPKVASTGLDLTDSYDWTGAHTFTGNPLGIGTASPDANTKLHIVQGAGSLPSGLGGGDVVVIQNNDDASDSCLLSLVSGATSGLSELRFSDADDADVGALQYSHSSNSLTFRTNGAAQAILTSTGVLGVNTASPSGDTILQITKGASTNLPTISSGNTAAIFENTNATTDDCAVAIIAGATGESALNFGDTADQDAGAIIYDHTNDLMYMRVGGNDQVMRLNSTGWYNAASSTMTLGCLAGLVIGFNASDITMQSSVFESGVITTSNVGTSGHVIEGRNNQNITWAGTVFSASCARAAHSGYSFFSAFSDNTSADDLEFRLYGDGNGKCDGSWTGGGADYAEMFETINGQSIDHGLFVTLEGDKVKPANNGDYVLGIISNTPSFLADAAWNKWDKKYLKNELGGYDFDENGYRKINENFNPEMEYISRKDRDEWVAVGMMGKLYVQTSEDITGDYVDVGSDGYAVNGTTYRVMEIVRNKSDDPMSKGYGVVRVIFR